MKASRQNNRYKICRGENFLEDYQKRDDFDLAAPSSNCLLLEHYLFAVHIMPSCSSCCAASKPCGWCRTIPSIMILAFAVLALAGGGASQHGPFADAFAYNQLPSETTRYLSSLDRNTSTGGVGGGGSSSSATTALHLAAEVGSATSSSGSSSSSSQQPAAATIITPDASSGQATSATSGDVADASPPTPKQSLYDVLRCPPTATKAELKRAYVLLAKQTHPDAQIGRTPEQIAAMEADPLIPSFHEVSGAWKLLSDETERKRYDRSLKADEFVESAEQWAATISDGAGSILSKTWQSQLSPFIKRTVSTVNNANAAFREELGDSSESDDDARKKAAGVGQVWRAAVEAARQAGRSISQQDMYEKAAELDERGK